MWGVGGGTNTVLSRLLDDHPSCRPIRDSDLMRGPEGTYGAPRQQHGHKRLCDINQRLHSFVQCACVPGSTTTTALLYKTQLWRRPARSRRTKTNQELEGLKSSREFKLFLCKMEQK
eukprot:c20699_g1_i3.p1 GENE.c20699_g1_i3~~c20699_g1_i3.p1  ORF type:complete len:117 (+),score=11.64 c20699_g1_i3:253-603(+)